MIAQFLRREVKESSRSNLLTSPQPCPLPHKGSRVEDVQALQWGSGVRKEMGETGPTGVHQGERPGGCPGSKRTRRCGKYSLVVASILSSIHPFPGAIPVGQTYPNMKRAPVLYNKVLEKQVREQIASSVIHVRIRGTRPTPAQPAPS